MYIQSFIAIEPMANNAATIGKIDIEFYPSFAEKYGVSGEAAAFDLPTLILFKDGKESKRLPELSSSKRAAKGKSSAPELSRKDAAKDTINRIGWNRSPVSDSDIVCNRAVFSRLILHDLGFRNKIVPAGPNICRLENYKLIRTLLVCFTTVNIKDDRRKMKYII